MSVTVETITTLAKLAKIGMTEDEKERFAREVGQMAAFADKLAELDTEGVAPVTHSSQMQSVMRSDMRIPALPREELLANAPEHDESFFLTPKVLD